MRLIKGILILLNYLVTILASAGMFLSYLSSITEPASTWWLPYFSLAAPFFVVLAVIMFLVNLVRLNFLAILPLIPLALSLPKVASQFNYPIRKEYPTSGEILKVASHNVYTFHDSDWQPVIDSTINFLSVHQPDIFAIQEYEDFDDKNKTAIQSALKEYKYSVTDFINEGEGGFGMAIYSKLKIVDSGAYYDEDLVVAQWADVVMKKSQDTIRFFNLHLKSNGISDMNEMLFNAQNIRDIELDQNEKDLAKEILKKLRDNSQFRAIQAQTVAQMVEESPYSVIVSGDFNDVPFSFSVNTIRGKLQDTFTENGRGYAYTFNRLMSLLKIDYVFVDDSYHVIKYDTYDVTYSDHNPIIVTLTYGEK
ncbi:MAG: endonuclease/exonuclease/phosphatase family protein [Rikenellaceae bacterium]